eukprot:m.190840 g.190840  ORF g.190840 m.190840 type:complete len:234 (+) comp18576_c0_seq4:140-841(+)
MRFAGKIRQAAVDHLEDFVLTLLFYSITLPSVGFFFYIIMAGADTGTKPLQEKMFYNRSDYIETNSGNKLCRNTVLCAPQSIVLQGKTIVEARCVIRGDLANVRVGRFTVIKERTVIRPPGKQMVKDGKSVFMFLPLTIGEHVTIGENSIINASSIGSFVHIGKNCVIGRRCVLHQCCRIADGTVLAPDTVVPPFMEMSGTPGTITGELAEDSREMQKERTKAHYANFIPKAQ